MTVDILICTYNDGIKRVQNIILPYREDISYKISHQITDPEYKTIPSDLNRSDIIISQLESKGLSKNRNNVLSMATGDLCFIADDDVEYTYEYIDCVINYFKKHNDVDILIGKIKTEGCEYKQYKKNAHKISWINIGSVSSIEIVFNRKCIIDSKIQFDHNFGLGGNLYNRGEEAIFMSDCLKSKLNIYYIPCYIVEHPYESTGKKIIFNAKEARYWGSLFYRIFHNFSYLLFIPLVVKLYPRLKNNLTISQFILNYLKGIKIYKNNSIEDE